MAGEGFVPTAIMRGAIRTGVRPMLSPRISWRAQRSVLDRLLGLLAVLPRDVTVTKGTLFGRPTEIATPASAAPDSVLLYLHGGGYAIGSPTTHRALVAHLAQRSGIAVQLLDYRLAPEHPFPAALDDAVGAFEELAAGTTRVLVAGDSAGGALSVSLAIRLRDSGRPIPHALGLICPWLDQATDRSHAPDRDPLLKHAWLAACSDAYCAGTDPADPLISPIYADPTGLPAMFVQTNDRDTLAEQGRRFVASVRAAGGTVTYDDVLGLWHVGQLNAGIVKDATLAVARLAEFLRGYR